MIFHDCSSFSNWDRKVNFSNSGIINTCHVGREPCKWTRCTRSILIIFVWASAANDNAAIWEHASPMPAMQVQLAQMIVPCLSAATHGLSGIAETACECLTRTVKTGLFGETQC